MHYNKMSDHTSEAVENENVLSNWETQPQKMYLPIVCVNARNTLTSKFYVFTLIVRVEVVKMNI